MSRWLRDERGSVLLFTTVMLVVLLVMGGMAIDLLYQTTVDNELQRSMDFAALAGAGKLSFDPAGLDNARAAARTYAGLNPYRHPNGGAINLDPSGNPTNDPAGNIVLGKWDGTAFTPAVLVNAAGNPDPTGNLDPRFIDAVKCQFAASVPTSFLRLMGSAFFNLPVAAFSVAWSPAPLTPPPNTCTLPIAVTDCSFVAGGAFNSAGCGTAITFISSSGSGPGTDPGSSNTGAWTNLYGGSPTPGNVQDAILAAAAGVCNAPTIQNGGTVPTNNGMTQPTFNTLQAAFITKFTSSGEIIVTNSPSTGNPVETYRGQGWQAYVPVISTGGTCPPGPINGENQITGWTTFTMTQVINLAAHAGGAGANGRCAVPNSADGNSWPLCNDMSLHSSFRGVFGYYSCSILDTLPSPAPGPRTAIADRLKLVK